MKDEPYPALWPDGVTGFDEAEFAELLGDGRGEHLRQTLNQPHGRGA